VHKIAENGCSRIPVCRKSLAAGLRPVCGHCVISSFRDLRSGTSSRATARPEETFYGAFLGRQCISDNFKAISRVNCVIRGWLVWKHGRSSRRCSDVPVERVLSVAGGIVLAVSFQHCSALQSFVHCPARQASQPRYFLLYFQRGARKKWNVLALCR